MKIIAKMKSDFPDKFGIPRQSGLVDSLVSTIIFEPDYRNSDALRGIDDFSHLWIIWQFSKAVRDDWSPTVRPPRLGGNTRMGVFATRSPFRPNAIGLSSVKILKLEHTKDFGTMIHVSGADLMDGTPIFDIKPYLPFADCHANATAGYAGEHENYALQVLDPNGELAKIPEGKRVGLLECLQDDPRPSYQDDPERVYGMSFGDYDIKFTVSKKILTVSSVDKAMER